MTVTARRLRPRRAPLAILQIISHSQNIVSFSDQLDPPFGAEPDNQIRHAVGGPSQHPNMSEPALPSEMATARLVS